MYWSIYGSTYLQVYNTFVINHIGVYLYIHTSVYIYRFYILYTNYDTIRFILYHKTIWQMFGTFSKNLFSLAFQFSIEHGKVIAIHILGLLRFHFLPSSVDCLLGEGTILLAGGFKYVLFSPLPGEKDPISLILFQMGCSHQLVFFQVLLF